MWYFPGLIGQCAGCMLSAQKSQKFKYSSIIVTLRAMPWNWKSTLTCRVAVVIVLSAKVDHYIHWHNSLTNTEKRFDVVSITRTRLQWNNNDIAYLNKVMIRSYKQTVRLSKIKILSFATHSSHCSVASVH